jgi:hypothetical protein
MAGGKEVNMKRFLKATILSAAVAAATLAPLSANAGDNWHGHGWGHYGGNDSGDLLAAGLIGLAVGALAVAATQPTYYGWGYDGYAYYRAYRNYYRPYRSYYPARDYYAAPRRNVVYLDQVGGIEPWTREWYDYCSNRYATFNPRTGTFNGYDGQRHFCVAR